MAECEVCKLTEKVPTDNINNSKYFQKQKKMAQKPFISVYNQVFKKFKLSLCEPKPELKVASDDRIIEPLLSLDNMKTAYDAILYKGA